MKKTLLAAALLSAFSTYAFAQATTTSGNTPAVVTSDTPKSGVLVEGQNSFTEAQAKERIAEAGYADVGALKLDDQGNLAGHHHQGRQVDVSRPGLSGQRCRSVRTREISRRPK